MTDITLRSFDIFDTLLARRCVEPHAIFRAVEAKAGHPGFAEMRIRAEAQLHAKGEYDLDDVYGAMAAGFGLSAAAAGRLRALELDEEFANLIPIRRHVAEVRPGDLLISDMYLPRDFLARAVAEKCGLHFNPIYLSSHGKSGGRAWEVLTRSLRIAEHLGDNLHADIEMSGRFGVPGRHTATAALTAGEVQVRDMGFAELALVMREARLGLWDEDEGLMSLGLAQIEANVPLLFLSALLLIEVAMRRGWRRLLFSARDCFMFYSLCDRLIRRLGLDLKATYFFTSRLSRVAPSPAYLAYFDSLCGGEPSAVVDICGTGWSLARLFEAAGRPQTPMFLLNIVVNPQLDATYRTIDGAGGRPVIHFVTRGGDSNVIEALNTTDHRMVADVVEAGGVFIPVFADMQAQPRYDAQVRFSHQAFALALAACEHIPDSRLFHWLSTVRARHVEQAFRAMEGFAGQVQDIVNQQLAENGPVAERLREKTAPRPD